jgi:hypothetical protein
MKKENRPYVEENSGGGSGFGAEDHVDQRFNGAEGYAESQVDFRNDGAGDRGLGDPGQQRYNEVDGVGEAPYTCSGILTLISHLKAKIDKNFKFIQQFSVKNYVSFSIPKAFLSSIHRTQFQIEIKILRPISLKSTTLSRNSVLLSIAGIK